MSVRVKLLLDQGLPRSSAFILRRQGIDTVHVGEIGLCMATDVEILQRSAADDRCVVTLDADFHAWLAVTGAVGPSVLRIRAEGMRGEAAAGVIIRILESCTDELASGAMATFKDGRVRLRKLPVREG